MTVLSIETWKRLPRERVSFHAVRGLKHWISATLAASPHLRQPYHILWATCCQKAADFSVTRLDYGVDQIATPVIGKKGALHCVDGDFLKVLQGQTKSILSSLEFFGHGRVAHQPVVGVQRDAEFLLVKNPKGMLGKAAGSSRMNVADQANLQRDPLF